jgi:hypothetical protein
VSISGSLTDLIISTIGKNNKPRSNSPLI